MLTIAVIEDHLDLRESIIDLLCAEGYRVGGFSCVEHFAASDFAERAEILVLDLNLPGEDGVSFARSLRAQGSKTGIIMLTSRSEVHQRAMGYSCGADIYLTKPSSPDELSAAVRSLALRISAEKGPATGLTLSRQAMVLTGRSGRKELSSSEVDMLEAFMASSEGRVPNEVLCRICQLTDPEAESKKVLEVRITRLRRKLEACDSDSRIRSIRGWGYQLSTRVRVTD